PSTSSGDRSSCTIHTVVASGMSVSSSRPAPATTYAMGMAFVDECVLYVRSGRGGDGSASMHSEPYKSRGGPDGGDGGAGGDVVLEVQPGVHDLSWLADHPHQRAEAGLGG